MKIFIPPLDTKWKLLHDIAVPASMLGHWNDYIDRSLGADYSTWSTSFRNEHNTDWVQYRTTKLAQLKVIPKDTIFVIERYHISHSGEDQITLQIETSPDARIRPKKKGGMGKGIPRVYIKVADLNQFGEMDQVP